MAKDNYIKSIYEQMKTNPVQPAELSDEEGVDGVGHGPIDDTSDEDNSLAADQSLEIEVEYLDGRDARVVHLKQGLNKVTIPEDKVDHYMSEIMGTLDANPSDKLSNKWEDDLPSFN